MSTDQPVKLQQLAQSKTFAGVDMEVLQALINQSQSVGYEKGSTVFKRGEHYKHKLFIIYQGKVELQRLDNRLRQLAEGDLLGLSNYLDENDYTSTAICRTDSLILEITDKALQSLEAGFPQLSNIFNRIIAERIRRRYTATHVITGALANPVRQYMKTPLSCCDASISLRDAFNMMDERKIGSLGVMTTDQKLLGVLTYHGLAKTLARKDVSPQSSILDASCETPRSIGPDAPLWQADERLQQFNTKYLIVMENDIPIGILSQSDVLRALVDQGSGLLNKINTTNSLAELQTHFDNLYLAAQTARETNRLASQAIKQLNELHLGIQYRCVELSLQQLQQDGLGEAPRDFSVLIMGSGGRHEMLLSTDQDNGLIIADSSGALSEQEQHWFKTFTGLLNQNLARIGYILCPGEIMARNPMFHKTLSQWQQQISHITNQPNAKAAQWANIVLDFETLYGNEQLTRALRAHVLQAIQQQPQLLEFMVEQDAEGRPALGLFNRLITSDDKSHKGKIDIKRNGLRIIADAARVFALYHGIAACNTVSRLNALVHQGVLSAELVDSAAAAYEGMLDLLLGQQIQQHRQQLPFDKYIDPDTLSSIEQSALRAGMRAVKRFQDQLQGRFGRSAL